MDKADRAKLVQDEIRLLLKDAGPAGMRRTAITEVLPHDWSTTTKHLDEMVADGRVTVLNRFYLSPGLEDDHREHQRNAARDRQDRILRRRKQVTVEIVVDGTPSGWTVKVPRWMADRQVDLCTPGNVPDEAAPKPKPAPEPESIPEPEPEPAPESAPEVEPEPEPEPANFWGTNSIPAGKPGLVLVPSLESGDLAEIEVPAQDFEWTPQVHTTGPHPSGGGTIAVMTLPVTAETPEPESFWM